MKKGKRIVYTMENISGKHATICGILSDRNYMYAQVLQAIIHQQVDLPVNYTSETKKA